MGNSSDDDVGREWLDANGGDPFVDDSIDVKVREEAGEHVEELDDSSDEDVVWREWLVANGGGPYADDSIDENVGEEAGEQLLLLREMLHERLQRLENIIDDMDSEKLHRLGNIVGDLDSETNPATKQQIDAEEAFDDDELEGADSNMNESSDEEEWQGRLEYLLNNCRNVEGGVSNLNVSSCVEMFRERLERLENIIDDLDSTISVNSNSDDFETDTDSSVDSETDTDSSADTETDPSSSVDFETDPATKQQINALPTSVVSQELLGLFSKDFCSICFGEFELDQEIKHPPCTHIFHTECLSTWLGKDRRCPYCRMSCIA